MLRLATLVCLAACGGKPASKPEPKPEPREPVQARGTVSDAETNLTPEMVLTDIQAQHMTGIKRCYKNHLKTFPDAKGRVVLAFTVLETGKADNVSASGFAEDVDTCIAALMPGWQFPAPLDRDGKKTSAEFKVTLQLIPD